MSGKISDYKASFYHRDSSFDFPISQNEIIHVAKLFFPFLPFVNVGKFNGQLITPIIGNGLRCFSAGKNIPHITVSVAAFGLYFYNRTYSMALTTIQDILLEIKKLRKENLTGEQIMESSAKIAANLLYLAVIARGGLELSMVALAFQIISELAQFRHIDTNKIILSTLRVATGICLFALRTQQLQTLYTQYNRNAEIARAISGVSVGKLHEKWTFTSTHLPIGVKVDGTRIASFYALDPTNIEKIQLDGQGLNGSHVTSHHEYSEKYPDLSIREYENMLVVGGIVNKGNDVIALQNCSEAYLKLMQELLPVEWEMLRSSQTGAPEQTAIMYNKNHLTYQTEPSRVSSGVFSSDPGKLVQEAHFTRADGSQLCVVNIDAPEASPDVGDVARHLHSLNDGKTTLVAIGNFNAERGDLVQAARGVGERELSVHTPYLTTVGTDLQSKAPDSAMVFNAQNSEDALPTDLALYGGSYRLKKLIQLLGGNTEATRYG